MYWHFVPPTLLRVSNQLHSVTIVYMKTMWKSETRTLSAHNLSDMLGAGNRDAFGHVHALFPLLLVIVVQGTLVAVQAEQGEVMIQCDVEGFLLIRCLSPDTAVDEEGAWHFRDFAMSRNRLHFKTKEGK